MQFAHRGYTRDGAQENTVESIGAAIARNLGVEIDVWLTKDNIAVVHHDSHIGKKYHINNLTLEELQQKKPATPSLSQVLKTLHSNTQCIIEVKQNHKLPYLIATISSSIYDQQLAKANFIIASKDDAVLRKIHEIDNEYRLCVIRGLTDLHWGAIVTETEASMIAFRAETALFRTRNAKKRGIKVGAYPHRFLSDANLDFTIYD